MKKIIYVHVYQNKYNIAKMIILRGLWPTSYPSNNVKQWSKILMNFTIMYNTVSFPFHFMVCITHTQEYL